MRPWTAGTAARYLVRVLRCSEAHFAMFADSPLFSSVSDDPICSSLSSCHPRLVVVKSQRANASACLAAGGGAAAMRPGLKALQQPLSAQVGCDDASMSDCTLASFVRTTMPQPIRRCSR